MSCPECGYSDINVSVSEDFFQCPDCGHIGTFGDIDFLNSSDDENIPIINPIPEVSLLFKIVPVLSTPLYNVFNVEPLTSITPNVINVIKDSKDNNILPTSTTSTTSPIFISSSVDILPIPFSSTLSIPSTSNKIKTNNPEETMIQPKPKYLRPPWGYKPRHYKTKLCQFFLKGYCKFGNDCAFIH